MTRMFVFCGVALVAGCYQSAPFGGHDDGVSDDRTGGDPAPTEDSVPPDAADAAPEPDDGVTPCDDLPACGALAFEVDWASECDPGTVWDLEPDFAGTCDPMLVMVGVYEASSAHHHGYHPTGTAAVRVTRTWRPMVLVLSAYEPVEWAIERDPGAEIEQILVYGCYDQIVSGVADVPIVDRSGDRFGAYADYSWPTGDGGDDPRAVVEDAESLTGLELSAFRGCYHAETMTISQLCEGGPVSRGCAWTSADFEYPVDVASCDGDRFLRFDERYRLWVGVVQCTSGLRFYLSESESGPYYPATDWAGHGQDFCELVDPSFTLPNEDNITSGGCSACSTGRNFPLEGVTAWARGNFGEPFEFVERTGTWSWQTSVVNCAVDVSEPPGSQLFCE